MSTKLYEIVAKVMSVKVSEINDESGPENIESWDSFNGLLLVDDLEANFNVKFELNEVTDVRAVSDIKRHLKNHGVKVDE